ncbi:MAG: hypothetical protein R2751_02740 [Bacteroidales bacterium]
MRPCILIAISLPLLVSCGSKASNSEYIFQPALPRTKLEEEISFLHSGNYTISDFSKSNDSHSSDPDTSYCFDWRLTKIQAREIFESAVPINGRDRHLDYDHLPCRYTGKIVSDEKNYSFEINAGSWIYLFSGDTTYIFGDNFRTHKYLYILTSKNLKKEN